MGHSYEASKSIALKTIILLAIITVVEVAVALTLKDVLPGWMIGLIMIAFSTIKAYYIIYEFMHMKYELNKLSLTVVLPLVLLVWGLIAFLADGAYYKGRRVQDSYQKEQTMVDVKRDYGSKDHNGHSHDHDNHGKDHDDHDDHH